MNLAHLSAGLAGLRFDNNFTASLPADPVRGSARRQIRGALYSRVEPQPAAAPELVAYSREVAAMLGLDAADCESAEFAEIFTGNRLLPGMDPHATCYAGHQFGNWAGQLGDGRAINLGEAITAAHGRQMLQLKGAGPTPYSRTADGFAVLRSSVREFLCSEAMYHLGVPTTRALSLTLTGDQVIRDMLYDGHPAPEPGAVVCRVAPSFTRFGHFEMLAARGEMDLLRSFLDFTVRSDFAHLLHTHTLGSKALALAWFAEVSERTAVMIAHWMRVGFVHGVMNTDNLSVLGLTIDYGPYGWLEDYDPSWTPNTTDAAGGRYRFGHQPAVAQWNLLQLANALFPLVEDAGALEAVLNDFQVRYLTLWHDTMATKLGLRELKTADIALLDELDVLLQLTETDMTLFYRGLAEVGSGAAAQEGDLLGPLRAAYYRPEEVAGGIEQQISDWLERYLGRLAEDGQDPATRRAAMNAVNPLYVPRNYLAAQAIDKAEAGDYSELVSLLEVFRRPYDVQPGSERFAAPRPDWARTRVGCSQLSCSS